MTAQLLEDLRTKFSDQINHFLTTQAHTYRKAAGFISTNAQLQQDIFENLIAILHCDDLEQAKKAATHALHASHELDSSLHFLLSYRTNEQKSREIEIENLTHEFNKTLNLIAAKTGITS